MVSPSRSVITVKNCCRYFVPLATRALRSDGKESLTRATLEESSRSPWVACDGTLLVHGTGVLELDWVEGTRTGA